VLQVLRLYDKSLDELGAIPVTTIAHGTSKPDFSICRSNHVSLPLSKLNPMARPELHEVLENSAGDFMPVSRRMSMTIITVSAYP